MKKEKMVPLAEVCKYYKAELAFINSLKEYELIEISTINKKSFIHHEQLHQLEKLVRLHYDLNVNLEGIDVIDQLLQRIESLQHEILLLKNKLRRFEDV